MVGNYLDLLPVEKWMIPEVKAAEENNVTLDNDQLGLIAILVEENLMDDFDLRSRIMTYAENAQARIPHSKSFVIEVSKDEDTFKIATLLENLYFEGVDTDQIDANPLNNGGGKEDDNQLAGVIVIGDVPLPVVYDENGEGLPSIYPYTDFYRKAFIFNHETGHFEKNDQVNQPTPEVWHGLINPPSKDPAKGKEELIAYFEKNNAYSNEKDGFADFEKRLMYANFPEMEKQMNWLDYRSYERYLSFMEEMVFNRYNKHLLKTFMDQVSADMGSEEPLMNEESIANIYDIQTENLFKQYVKNFSQSLSNYRGGLNDVVEKTGRWNPGQVDSPESLITLRDEYAKAEIYRKQLLLEKKVDDFIEDNVPQQQREIQVTTGAELSVTLKILEVPVDNRSFDFFTRIDGRAVKDMKTAQQCGIQIGQEKPEDTDILENNSVLANANKMYNPESLVTPPDDPPDDWAAEDDPNYGKYGGCVFNNTIIIEETGSNPNKCHFEDATQSLFDVRGSIEVKENEPVYSDQNRCEFERMSFLPLNYQDFEDIAAGAQVNDIQVGENLGDVMEGIYEKMNGNLSNPTLQQKANFVIQKLLDTNESYSYSPIFGAQVTVSLKDVTEKKLDSIYPHVEPTPDHIKTIKHIGEPRVDEVTGEVKFPQITNPGLASDGIRYIYFLKNGIDKTFEYLNLFRVKGNNESEVTENLLAQINEKQSELNAATETNNKVFENFFAENSEIFEPMNWQSMSIDQKLETILPKYLDRDSFMPTPFYNPKKSPQNKPEGYEVLHIVADGDAQGFEFGLNRAVISQQQGLSQVNPLPPDDNQNEQNPDDQNQNPDDLNQNEGGNYVCGDPSGVEIWEWFDALQCWIDEEILPAEDLFALSQTCTAAPLPPQQEEESDDVFDDILATPSKFKVEMKRKSLVVGQPATLTISAYNNLDEPVLGYIDMPVHFEMKDESLGEFSDNDIYLFTGIRDVQFTPSKTGSTEVTIQMGNLEPQTFEVHVYPEISLEWKATEEVVNGRSEFSLDIRAIDGNKQYITDIDDVIFLAPEQPADGGFENEGKVTLNKGYAKTRFIPTPGKQKINLFSKDLYIGGQPLTISPTPVPASQLMMKAPEFGQIGKPVEIEIIAADSFGIPSGDFSGKVDVSLDEGSKALATLEQETIQLTGGKGIAILNAGAKTGELKLSVKHPNLKGAQISIPLLARVEATQWKETYPQNLFASFVGFPAGDYSQENYFGGVHLMAGKTEAVYSFLSAPKAEPNLIMYPNNLVQTRRSSQSTLVEFLDNQMLLQVFDTQKMQTLLAKKIPLSFNAVKTLPEENLEKGTLYWETLDSNFIALEKNNGIDLNRRGGGVVATLRTNRLHILDNSFKWEYVDQPEFGAIELNLTDGLTVAVRVILNFGDQNLNLADFEEVNPNLDVSYLYSGNSVNDAKGLYFSEHGAETPEAQREEFYGLEGQNKYLSLFASGVNIGEAVKYNLPTSAILLGDPTIKLKTSSSSSLNYNAATGEKIYQDPEGAQVVSINHFNYNNDKYQDVAVLLDDGRVRLLEGGPTEPPYEDRGNIALLADGGVALEVMDLKNDGYEDLLVATDEGRLAILNNENEIIHRSDQKLNIGKKMKKLLRDDMDQDGADDLIVLDSRGDIYIFYYNKQNQSFPENGQLIGNYGFTLKLDTNLSKDLDLRYSGILEPKGLNDGQNKSQQSLDEYEGGGEIDPIKALEFIKKLEEENKQAAEDPNAKSQNEVPKLPWPEGSETETYFAPIESVLGIVANKTVHNKERPEAKNVDIDEVLTYEIEISSGGTFNQMVFADSVPDALTFDAKSVQCLEGPCGNVEVLENGVKIFFSKINLAPGQKIKFSYDAMVKHTPEADLLIKVVDEPNQNLDNPNAIIDNYKDILVSPPYNNTGKLLIHYTTGPRSYALTQSNDPPVTPPKKEVDNFKQIMAQMEALENAEFDEDNPPPPLKLPGLGDALDDATGNNDCFEDPESNVSCAEEALDKAADAISELGCIGGGCFPMPYNRAFLVPPGFPLPVFAFPTTLPTPVGPMPFVWPGSFIGAASIPGPITSLLRFYIAPTLTGGIGIAMCWNPYPVSPTVPPPVFPIPYPPPIGNCMVTALPVDKIYGGLCSDIENGITKLMDLMAAGVNKVEATINDANNNPNLPVNIQTTGPDAGAGGLEISLAINLGESIKFDPPVQSFSNIHIPSFDSVQGVISKWFDRQFLEIKNKLLTLPTFSIYMPDFKSLFTLDADKTQRQFEAWYNTMDGSAAATLDAIKSIDDQEQVDQNQTGLTMGQEIRSGLSELSGSKALQYKNAIETQAQIYNLNALEGLYDVASTLPLVKLTQKPIEFKVPWLSSAQIQSYILELQKWVIYYELEYDRVKDKWEALTCDDQPDTTDARGFAKNSTKCVGRKLADAFGTNFDEIINSAKANIEVLQSYLAFPKNLANYKTQLAGYVGSLSCYLDILAQMMGGYMKTLQQQMIAWAEMILTVVEVVKNIKDLFNVFTNFDTTCDTCMNERYANFGWWSLLGLLLPDLPIIEFPKIPDIVLDLSNIDLMLDVEIPVINIRPEPIPLPPLPYITLPDFPTVDLLLQLPPLPILPSLPELPPLPDLPPLPTVDLPTLPPPPKLPDVGKGFETILPLLEKVLQTWCMLKKSLAPVPERALGNQVTLLTNRPAYLIPLDLLQVQLPKIAPFDLGFNEVRIQTLVYLGLKLNVVSRPLEELSQTWNDWIKAIPESMNAAYESYLEATEGKIQGYLDEAEQFMEDNALNFEQAFDQYVQGWLDKNIGDPLEEADKWLANKEAEWQTWAEENKIDWTYEQYLNAVNNFYSKIRNTKNDAVNEWFDKNRDLIHAMNYLIPAAGIFEIANEENLGEYMQEALDLTAEKLNEFEALGPTLLPRLYTCLKFYKDCRENQDKYFGLVDKPDTSLEAGEIEKPALIAEVPNPTSPATIVEKAFEPQEMLDTPQGEEIKKFFAEMSTAINDINSGELVDYTVLKKRFGVEDYVMKPRATTVDKLERMGEALEASSEQLLAEAQGLKHIKDPNAIAGVGEREILPYEFVDQQADEWAEQEKIYTNILPPKNQEKQNIPSLLEKEIIELQQKVEQEYGNNQEQIEPVLNDNECKVAVCLPDPNVNSLIPVIPAIDLIAKSEVLFMPSGHLIYSDGTGLYLKRDLTIDETQENVDGGVPQRFTMNEMMNKTGVESLPKEAVNMLKTTFTEEGAATFNWTPTSHPDVYGYGIEMKKPVNGYKRRKQAASFRQVKIILLPPDEEGNAPEVFAGDVKVSYGTLVTNLTDETSTIENFGLRPQNILLDQKEIHFPTINNAQIDVTPNTAVYFDKLSGSAYSIEMENEYQQIRMTWFDAMARTSNYNQNEILAPQIYGDESEPIDIGQQIYYVPLYKEKQLTASDIFIDLGGGFDYYWYVDPDNNKLSAVAGPEFTLAPQKEVKKIKVKLVATKNILDESFRPFEKTFIVQVYAPEINLNEDALQEGVVAGAMANPPVTEGEDLSSIPFSVFRKRAGSWKNLGLLHASQEKTPTQPPLNDHEGKPYIYPDSYYSANETGGYSIDGFDHLQPSGILIKDTEGNIVAEVLPGKGKIVIYDDQYDLLAIPAGINSPTHIAIVKKQTTEILANVYYLADGSQKVTLKNEALTSSSTAEKGVTVGDVNLNDPFVMTPLPEEAPSFGGGVAIFDQETEKNMVMVDKDGTIRFMEADLELKIKDKFTEDPGYIFQIIKNKQSIFEVFIQANWNNLNIDTETNMNTLQKQIGLQSDFEKVFAPLLPESVDLEKTPQTSNQTNQQSPFPDVPSTHPFFQAILDLYDANVVEGYSDGTFKPDQKLTRAEFVKIAFGAANCYDCENPTAVEKSKYQGNPFPDVSLPAWYYYCIWLAKELGMVTGYGDGFFRPNQNISRAEAASVLLRQAEIDLSEAPNNGFLDVKGDAWYVDYVYTARSIGLIQEQDGLIKPDEQISRGEFAFMAANLKNYKQCVPLCPCGDNPNQNDSDGDGVRDVCDADIDGDGSPNPICIFNDLGLLDLGLLKDGADKLGAPVDNCLFIPNTDQKDYDQNGVGDMCETCACSNNPNQNDTDGDGIPDKCDNDIDNDTVTNPLCIFDESGLLDEKKLLGKVDNCIFDPNSDQQDLNGNGIGDACEGLDLCPGIPEDIDGVQDGDGCPELTDNFPEKDSGVYVSPGPLCSLLDFSADLMPGDMVMTAITDLENHDVIFSQSKEVIYQP